MLYGIIILFKIEKKYFNDFINNWNVSAVTNMRNMFLKASSFDRKNALWNVSY